MFQSSDAQESVSVLYHKKKAAKRLIVILLRKGPLAGLVAGNHILCLFFKNILYS